MLRGPGIYGARPSARHRGNHKQAVRVRTLIGRLQVPVGNVPASPAPAQQVVRAPGRTDVTAVLPVPSTPAEPLGPITVDIQADRCVGCLTCADTCRQGAITRLSGAWAASTDLTRCTGCRRCEKVCPFGVISVSGTPYTPHRMVLDRLHTALRGTCPGGWSITTDGPAFWTDLGQPSVRPDLTVLRGPSGTPQASPGHVALVIEIVAPHTLALDLGRKLDLYRQRDVPTYWTVDQRSGEVTVHWSDQPAWFDWWADLAYA